MHLFVQRGSASRSVYLGVGRVAAVRDNAPMTVTFELAVPLSDGALAVLGGVLDA